MKKKILTIIGARPQFVKASVVSKALAHFPALNEIIVHTGQHYDADMSDIFFEELEIKKPAYNLGIHGSSNEMMIASMLESIGKVIEAENPDLVLVYGDTNSTLAGALSARFHSVPLAHIEAGMRNHDLRIAEELNRVITDRIADYLFCSTEIAFKNLEKENLKSDHCFLCGDVMYDALLYFSEKASAKKLSIDLPENYIICSLHRSETVDNREKLQSVIKAINKIAGSRKIIMPLHPRTKKRLSEFKIDVQFELIQPAGYLEMLQLLKNCSMTITDSGGLQKEAFLMKKPSLVLRDKTEWQELADHGYVISCGTQTDQILKAFTELSNRTLNFSHSFYGDGNSAHKIASILANVLK